MAIGYRLLYKPVERILLVNVQNVREVVALLRAETERLKARVFATYVMKHDLKKQIFPDSNPSEMCRICVIVAFCVVCYRY